MNLKAIKRKEHSIPGVQQFSYIILEVGQCVCDVEIIVTFGFEFRFFLARSQICEKRL